MRTKTRSVTRRLMSVGAAATVGSVALMALAAPAQAADVNSQVWVCKYVGTPGGNEVLGPGKNPIEVSGSSVDKDKDGQIYVGDQFSDAQGRSVVVQIGGEDPGASICAPTPPPVTPDSTPTPAATVTPAAPGASAPRTGGDDAGLPLGLIGGAVLLGGAGVLAADAQRRRREAARR
jgi:uncharacterized membrane protein